MSGTFAQSFPVNDDDPVSSSSGSTSPGGDAEIQWSIVARTAGLAPASILAGRLQAEGIPARAYQEGAGRALGLTVGILGTGFVAVPQEYAEEAVKILEEDGEAEPDDDNLISGVDVAG